MAVANLRPIADALVSAGRPATTAAVVVENASLPHQRIVRATLRDLADTAESAEIVPPAVVVIGDVVSGSLDAGDARP
jgi:siroheme synthase